MVKTREFIDQITINVKNHALGTNAALLTVGPDQLVITWGQPTMLGVKPVKREVIEFAEAPEIKPIYGPAGWDPQTINALVSGQ